MKIAVLVSGRGSNLVAILQAAQRGEIPAVVAVLSNAPGCEALARAAAAGVPTLPLDPKPFASREAYDAALAAELRRLDVGLVCLAGYMRLLGRPMTEAFAGRILNVHPSLLPAFPGLHAQRQALAAGARISGCTVHFVDAGTDTGPIVAQVAVPVSPTDTEATLSARILEQEHRLYARVIRWVADGRVRIDGSTLVWRDAPAAEGALASPALTP